MTEDSFTDPATQDSIYGSRHDTLKGKRRKQHHSLIYRIAAGAGAAVLLLAGVGIYATHKTVTVQTDDEAVEMSTWHSSADAVVDQAGMEVGPHARLADDRTTVSDGDTIVVEKAKHVTVMKDGKQRQIWTFAPSAKALLSKEDINEVPLAGTNTDTIPAVKPDTSVKVKADGRTKKVTVAKGETLREALKKAEIDVKPLDRLSMVGVPAAGQGTAKKADGAYVEVNRVERVTKEQKSKIAAPVKEENDDSMYEGEKKVVDKGRDGIRVKQTYIEKVNGKVVFSQQLKDKVVKEPQEKIIKVGTKKRPEASSSSAGASSSSAAGATYSGSGVWGALAQCESGGNPRIVSSNGLYHGLYQFSVSTWRSVGGSGLPSQASPAEQTKRAKILQQRAGWGQWPVCSRKIGAR